MRIKKKIIIGLLCIVGLTVYNNDALALYSPRLSQRVRLIQEHMMSSQAQTGGGTILEEVEQIKAYNRAKRELNEETGISGDASLTVETFLRAINPAAILDSLAMVFNYNYTNNEWISTCLRDDIWQLEELRNLVGAEMLKAYMLRDTYHGTLLSDDYKYLTTHINLLRMYGSDPDKEIPVLDNNDLVYITSSEYFFGEEAHGDPPLNYYSNVSNFLGYGRTACPEGEFDKAIEEVVNSAKTVYYTVGGNSAFSSAGWGSIWEMAQANARKRAAQWIRANQISLTLGGEEGGRLESLVKGGGPQKFWGNVKSQLQILENMVGPVTPLFEFAKWVYSGSDRLTENCVFYYPEGDVFRNCTSEQRQMQEECEDDEAIASAKNINCDRFRNLTDVATFTEYAQEEEGREARNAQVKKEVKTAFIYNMTFDAVAEENIYFMDDIMWDMVNQIKRGYQGAGEEAGLGIPTLTREIEALTDRQCANR
ncbi:hypothetical protein JXD20_04525 [Candidatus Peregrinibacteria bacterium]|nr:hypothetical protein [Candidatus Peregrinibacteria bacterium]